MILPRRIALLGLLLALVSCSAAADPAAKSWSLHHQGSELSVALAALAGDRTALRADVPIDLRLEARDALTATPLSGLEPAAWLDPRLAGEDFTSASCQQLAEAFLGGSLLTPPAVDLNAYTIVTLNDDPTVSVHEPRFGLGDSRLEAQVELPAVGEDWVLSPDQSHLFVTLPVADRVAILETTHWPSPRTLEVDGRPRRIVRQPDSRQLWVGRDGSSDARASGVTVIEGAQQSVVAHIATGAGAHDIAFSSDGRFAFVTNQEANTLSIVDAWSRAKVRDLHLGEGPVSVAYSELSQAAYVVHAGDGTIAVVDGRQHRLWTRIETEPGAGGIRFAPGGRWGFIAHPSRQRIDVLDVSSQRIVHTASVNGWPERVSFSDELAYVRQRDSEIVWMIPLGAVGRQGTPLPLIDFPGGQHPFGQGGPLAAADGIVQVPGANAVLVANPSDEAVYFYKEGMAAPMGELSIGGHRPRAVLALDRSLREVAAGIYQTHFRVPRSGPYRLVLYLDNPRLVRCFEIEVEPEAGAIDGASQEPTPTVKVVSRVEPERPSAGQPLTLRFRFEEASSGRNVRPPGDVRVATYLAPGRARRELKAEASDGWYVVRLQPAEPGVYYVFVECSACPAGSHPSVRQPDLTFTVLGRPPAGNRPPP